MPATGQESWIKVWDPVVRYGHWALVAMFAVAYLSGEGDEGGADLLHSWSGYAIAAIIGFRLVWGLIGTRHARFSDFAYGPSSVRGYLTDMLGGRTRQTSGWRERRRRERNRRTARRPGKHHGWSRDAAHPRGRAVKRPPPGEPGPRHDHRPQ